MKDIADDLIKFCKTKIKQKFARADYKEFLQLMLIFLGSDTKIDDESSDESDETDESFTFRGPGAISQARWMAKAIYILKICLFRSEFCRNAQQANAIRDLSIFIVCLREDVDFVFSANFSTEGGAEFYRRRPRV